MFPRRTIALLATVAAFAHALEAPAEVRGVDGAGGHQTLLLTH
jgi:hypothetical protein